MLDRTAIDGGRPCIFELLGVLRRELRAVDRDGQLVELGGQRERRLVVGVVDPGQGIRADVEALVPLQDDGQRVLQLLRLHNLAIHLEDAGAGLPDAAHVVVGEGAIAKAVVLEVELDGVLSG